MRQEYGTAQRRERLGKAWLVAAILALVWHGGLLVALRTIRLPETAAPARKDAIAVTLVPGAEAATRSEPKWFTEQPDDGTKKPPEHPEFLSNVDATAQDLTPGGEDARPRMTGGSEFPQVAMVPGEGGNPTASEQETRTEDAGETREKSSEPHPEDAAKAPSTTYPAAMPPVLEQGLRDAARTGRTAGAPGSPGVGDLFQEAMNSASNANATGDIRLSTTAWEYAPWLQAFRRALLARWNPPQAYFLGMIRGWALLEVEVARDGSVLQVNVLDQKVDHWSLTDSAANALRRAAPYRPLPDTFPDETLKLQIRFTYPGARE